MPGFNIGTGSLASADPTRESHRNHRWRIIMLGPIALTDNLLFAKTLQLPNLTIEEESVQGASLTYKFAKSGKWDDVTITFYDMFGLEEELNQWRDLVYDSVKVAVKPAVNYKGGGSNTCEFELNDGKGRIKRRYTLVNAWPKQIAHGALAYDNSDIKVLTITITYDFATITSF